MKKLICVCLFAAFFVSLLFTSCENETIGDDMNHMFINEELIDDDKTIVDNLTKQYDLKELQSFFKDTNTNESVGLKLMTATLMFNDVNQRYPVEILRSGGYSIYSVSQGGYFYVFWIKPFDLDAKQVSGEPSVYFSAYLSSEKSLGLFNSIKPGISTAKDVKEIDPYFELSFLMSNGVFSYSFLNEEELLEIKYEVSKELESYDDLVVKEVNVVLRSSAPSRYSIISKNDLPRQQKTGIRQGTVPRPDN